MHMGTWLPHTITNNYALNFDCKHAYAKSCSRHQRWLSNGQTISPVAADSLTWFVRICFAPGAEKLRKCHNASLPSRTYSILIAMSIHASGPKNRFWGAGLVCCGEKIALNNYCQIWLGCVHHIHGKMHFILPVLELRRLSTQSECWQISRPSFM
jgi:hypothetical protein